MRKREVEEVAAGLFKPINPSVSILLGILTFLWGLWVVNPFWDVFTRADIYSKAADFAPEAAWGTWSTLCGLFLIVSIVKGSTTWVARTAAFAVWHWSAVAVMFWWGDWQNTAGLTYSFIALYAAYIFLNVRVNWVKQGIRRF